MKISGARLIVEALIKEKVDVLFAFPGGAVIPLFDGLFKQKEIRVVLVRHEQAAPSVPHSQASRSDCVSVYP